MSYDVMVSKLLLWIFYLQSSNKFNPHWVPYLYNIVLKLR